MTFIWVKCIICKNIMQVFICMIFILLLSINMVKYVLCQQKKYCDLLKGLHLVLVTTLMFLVWLVKAKS